MPAVSLSVFGGVGAQFFDNNGVILTGGKIFTYEAGTTTPLATYTSSTGATAHTNPIILDSGGRVPDGGEIWILAQSYKFVLKDSNDVLIVTWDNISGAGAVSTVNYMGDGTTISFAVLGSVESIFINGVYQNRNTYTSTTTTVIFSEAPPYTSKIEINYI